MSKNTTSGRFIVIEGADGAGKTTTAESLVKVANSEGQKTILVREPGGTALGEAIRKITLDKTIAADDLALIFAFFAARAQLYKEVVAPALAQGVHVVCDRGVLSTIVYQGLLSQDKNQDTTPWNKAGIIKAAHGAISAIAQPFVTCVLLPTPEEYEFRDARKHISGDRFESSKEKVHKVRMLYETYFGDEATLKSVDYMFGNVGMVRPLTIRSQTPDLIAHRIAKAFLSDGDKFSL